MTSESDEEWLRDVADAPAVDARAVDARAGADDASGARGWELDGDDARAASRAGDAARMGGADVGRGYVVASGGLGALFGGDDDEDWMRPAAARDADADADATRTRRGGVGWREDGGIARVGASSDARASGPFAAPVGGRDDGMEFFGEWDARAEADDGVGRAGEVGGGGFGFDGARASAEDGCGDASAIAAAVVREHRAADAVAAAASFHAQAAPRTPREMNSAPVEEFYEQAHAPFEEYAQTEFVSAHEDAPAEYWAQETLEPETERASEHVEWQQREFPESVAGEQTVVDDRHDDDAYYGAPITSSHAAHAEGPFVDSAAPPIVPAYTYSSENLHSRGSSTSSIPDVLATPSSVSPMPTFMIPEPIQQSPMAVIRAVPHTEAPETFAPPPRASAGYASYEPVHPPQSEYAPDVGAGYAGYAQPYGSSQPQYPPAQLQYPPAQPQYPPAQPQYAPAQPQYSAAQPQYSAAQPQYSAAHPQYSAAQPQYSAAHPQYSAYSETQTRKPVGHDDSERSPDGRPQHVAICFGFGGSLALTGPGYPGGRQSHGTSVPPCSVQIHSVRALLHGGNTLGTQYMKDMELLVGPLGNRRAADVAKMIDTAITSEGDRREESEALLYRVLQTMLLHQGELTPSGDALGEKKSAVSEISRVLTSSSHDSSTSGWVSANAGISPLNPAGESDERAIVQVESLLIAGRRGDALKLAIEAKLWPHALLLAGHLGGRHYQETLAIMAKSVCKVGSPLHTLEIVMAGLPQELTASATEAAGMSTPVVHAAPISKVRELLPRWREHIAILCSNPMNASEFVLKSLGDELWRQGNVSGAHIAYALSKERPTPYSFNSRLCLVGSDHRKFPRTYVTPRAVQLSEILESALVGSNPQAQFPSLLPYKLVYAGALAEVGKLKRALAYVESVLKSVRSLDKNSPEVNVALVGALASQMEDRLQSVLKGKGGRLADAAKFMVSGVKGLLDRSVSSLFGDGGEFQNPPPLGRPHEAQQSSSSHSYSAPPQKASSPATTAPPVHHERTPSGNLLRSVSSLFGGGASKPVPSNEPTVSQENAFYYDEQRKMWCERGKEPPKEAPPVGPPPVRNLSDHTVGGLGPESSTPPPIMAPSAYSKQPGGVHSRYVDTFNYASPGAMNSSPAPGFVPIVPSANAAPRHPGNFFVPGPSASHSREESHSESYSYSQHERTGSDGSFYGYDVQTSADPQPPRAPNSIPRPPSIDPSLLATITAPLPAFSNRGSDEPAVARVAEEELRELSLQ